MELDFSGEQTIHHPVLIQVYEFLEKLQADPDDTFLILSTSEQHYLQAICTDEGFYLEWRGGSDATHVGTDRMDLSLEEAQSAFRQYWEQHQE